MATTRANAAFMLGSYSDRTRVVHSQFTRNVKAVVVRSEPRGGFEFEQVGCPAPFVAGDFWIPQHQPLAAFAEGVMEQRAELALGFNGVAFDNEDGSATGKPAAGGGKAHRVIPCDLWRVEHGEGAFRGEAAMLHGEAGGLKLPAPGENLAVEREAFRQASGEPVGGRDDVSAACPELRPIPVGSASVELFGDEEAPDGPAIVVSAERHGFLIHGAEKKPSLPLSGRNGSGLASLRTNPQPPGSNHFDGWEVTQSASDALPTMPPYWRAARSTFTR